MPLLPVRGRRILVRKPQCTVMGESDNAIDMYTVMCHKLPDASHYDRA
jgi:hypothetical protein